MTEKQLDQVLAWINRQRVNLQKRKPLKRIPKGYRRSPQYCPIAKALNTKFKVMAETRFVKVYDAEGKIHKVNYPLVVKNFVYEFDNERLPKLIK